MSGIYGFVKIGNDDETIAEGRAKGLRRWNRDYGCDDEGEMTGEGFAIGCFVEHFAEAFHAGTPVFEDGDLLYAIDAVIYNRDELDAALGESDEEVIIRVIEDKGYSALKDVNGDFAGAVFNKGTRGIKLFRDHLGVRPLYYYLKDGLMAFSTDIRGLGAQPDADLKIDEKQLWLELAGYNEQTLDRTHFEYIRCVLPGSAMTFTKKEDVYSVSTDRYFVPGKKKVRLKNDEQYIARMRELVEDSIRRRLDAFPGRIGAELSGGLDSSVIDILINRMRPGGKYVSWYSVWDDWPLQPEDERLVIRDIGKQEKLDIVALPDVTFPANHEKTEPIFSNTLTIGKVAELVSSEGIRVVFSGQGGDEGISHREDVLELFRAREYGRYLKENWYYTKGEKNRVFRFIWRIASQILRQYPARLKPWHTDNNSVSILNKGYLKRMERVKGSPLYFCIDPALEFEYGGVRIRPETAAYQAAEFGVRYVFPYEDFRVFDYALSIPRNLYLRKCVKRWIYREAFEDIIPDSLKQIVYKGLNCPLNQWPESECDYLGMFKQAKEKLDRERWKGYLDFDAIDGLEYSYQWNNKKEGAGMTACISGMELLARIQDFQNLQNGG